MSASIIRQRELHSGCTTTVDLVKYYAEPRRGDLLFCVLCSLWCLFGGDLVMENHVCSLTFEVMQTFRNFFSSTAGF